MPLDINVMGDEFKSVNRILWEDFLSRVRWRESFAWLPHRCFITREWIWLRRACQGIAVYRRGDLDFITESHWAKMDEFIVWKLSQ